MAELVQLRTRPTNPAPKLLRDETTTPLAFATPVRADCPLITDTAKPSRLAGWLLLAPTALGIGSPFWLALMACTFAFFVLFGWAVNGHWFGIFVGRTNSISLSITQALLWSTLVLPALITAFATRLASNPVSALDIGFDPSLAMLMGIPVLGLAGAKIITSGKAGVTRPIQGEASKQVNYARSHLDAFWEDYRQHHLQPSPTTAGLDVGAMPDHVRAGVSQELRKALQSTKPQAISLPAESMASSDQATALADSQAFAAWLATYLKHNRNGILVHNQHASEASLRDLIEGDEVGDEGRTDFGKAQFLVVTLISLAAYAAALGWMFANLPAGCGSVARPCITALPVVSGALPTILLTATVGYLGMKAAPSTATK